MSDATPSIPSSIPSPHHEIMERLRLWSVPFEQRRSTQLGFLEVMERHVMVHLRTYYADDVDPRFVQDLLDAALSRLIIGRPQVYVEMDHAPYRPDGEVYQEIPAERIEIVETIVEGVGGSMISIYQDYLARHWQKPAQGLEDIQGYQARIAEICKQHTDELQTLLSGPEVAGLGIAQVRELIEEHMRAWYEQPAMLALAGDEKARVDSAIRTLLPDWYKKLDEADVTALRERRQGWKQAHAEFDDLLGEARSLHDHARQLATRYLREQLDLELSADIVSVKRKPLHEHDAKVQELTLTELVSEGVIDAAHVYAPLQVSVPLLHCQAPTPEQLQALLSSVDAPASYLEVLGQRHQDVTVKRAMFDAYDAELRYSLLLAKKCGHLPTIEHTQLEESLDEDSPNVYALQLAQSAPCSDLLLFFLAEGEMVLYAPGKPDGQEWIELVSQRALNAEIGSWFGNEAGRQYLLAQVPFDQLTSVSERLLAAVEKPSEWSLEHDLRQALRGYKTCLKQRVTLRMKRWEDEVQSSVSPRYLSSLSLEERRLINREREIARKDEQAFADALGAYESFHYFAKRSITDAIAPYLIEKGITEAVDPESIIFDITGGQGEQAKSLSLLDLVCYGYSDNDGLDHPEKQVRSLVGQDLSQLRGADLTYYARRAYIGERYLAHIRATFLDPNSDDYSTRQRLFGRALVSAMDRDLRLARARAEIDSDTYAGLREQVTGLAQTLGQAEVAEGSTSVVTTAGVFRLSIDDCVVLGVYVLRHVSDGVAHDWLYTPDAPDGLLLREYRALNAAGSAVLRDYLLNRVALKSRSIVAQRLLRLADNLSHRDSLRGHRHIRVVTGEFNFYIEHGLSDVDDATQSRAEVIRGQIFKGVLFASAPLLLYPPFALLFSLVAVAAPVREGIIAHTRGETSQALRQWLEASWSALGAVLAVPGLNLKLFRSLVPLLRRPQPRRIPVSGNEREPSMRFDKAWAVRERPANLQQVTEEGIWKGTYRSGSVESPQSTYFIRSGTRYYQVTYDAKHGTLRVLKANRPHAYHREAVKLHADGRWVSNSTGLRGGNHIEDAGTLTQARQVTAGEGAPSQLRGALQGEVVVSRYAATQADNYLYTVNAQTCVAVSLYNPTTRAGAVLHIDHNVHSLIEAAVKDALAKIEVVRGSLGVRAVMAGGDWLGSANIGNAVRAVLRRNGVQPSWQHWSYSSCFGGSYGMTLDLGTGVTRVYRTPMHVVEDVLNPIMSQTIVSEPIIARRAQRFITRVKSDPVYEAAGAEALLPAELAFHRFHVEVL